jgi:hypothetical protein
VLAGRSVIDMTHDQEVRYNFPSHSDVSGAVEDSGGEGDWEVGHELIDDWVNFVGRQKEGRQARCVVKGRLEGLTSREVRRVRAKARRVVAKKVANRQTLEAELLELSQLTSDPCPLSNPSLDGSSVFSSLNGAFLLNYKTFVGSGSISAVTPMPRAECHISDIFWDTGAYTVIGKLQCGERYEKVQLTWRTSSRSSGQDESAVMI